MKWKFIVNGAPLGSCDLSGGHAPRKKEWLPYVLAGASLVSTLWGGAQAAKENRRAERALQAEKARNEAWYTRRYNENYADTAAGQNMKRMALDAAREHWRREAGAAAVAGGTASAVAQAKEAGNRMVGDTIARMAATDTARKDNVDAAYRAEKSRLTQQQMALDQQKAQNIADVAGGVSNALMTGAMYAGGSGTAAAQPTAGSGSPGGGGVEPSSGTPALEKMGGKLEIPRSLSQTNDNYSLLKKSYLYNPELFWGK